MPREGKGGRARNKLVRLLEDLDVQESDNDINHFHPDDGSLLEGSQTRDEQSDSDEGTTDDLSSTTGDVSLSNHQREVAYGRYQVMEKRAVQLLAENKGLQALHDHHVKQTNLEVAELRAHLRMLVHEMEERQKEVEAKAPIVKARLEDYRDRLQDLRVSEAQYVELLSMPPEGLHVIDQVKIAVYEQTRDLSREAEQLRLALATSRDAAARLEEEAMRLRAENARAGAALVERDKEARAAIEGTQSRISRLSAELEQALIRAELNSAKGAMYDELRVKAERSEAECQRLMVVEATFRRMEQQLNEAEKHHRQREHSVEMLQMDKAYLSKQVEFMGEQQRKTQGELEMREQQVQELQRARNEMYEKLMEAENSKGRHDEARLHKELAQLQASTHADLERIRVETAETYEREARLLRELRDQAVSEAARLRIAHSELQDIHDKSVSVNTELQRRLETQLVEMQAELRNKSFELRHVRMVLGEKEGLLGQASMQVELLHEKMQVLRDRCVVLEVGQQGAADTGGRALAVLDLPKDDTPGGLQDETSRVMVIAGSSSSSIHADAMSALRRENAELLKRVTALEAQLQDARSSLALVGQPHAFLLGQLDAAKARAAGAESHNEAFKARLADRDGQVARLTAERDELRRDLDALLVQRAGLDRMKQLVMRAVGAGGGGGGALLQAAGTTGSAAPFLIQGIGPHETTTIL